MGTTATGIIAVLVSWTTDRRDYDRLPYDVRLLYIVPRREGDEVGDAAVTPPVQFGHNIPFSTKGRDPKES